MSDELTSLIEAPARPGPGKLTLTCREFKTVEKGTLRGFATIYIREMRLAIREVQLHEKGDSRWASLPSKPQIDRDGRHIVRDGKPAYSPLFDFDTKAVRDAFSARAVEAIDAFRGGRS